MPPGRKSSLVIELSITQRDELLKWRRSTTISAALYKRALIILLIADKMPLAQIGEKIDIKRDHVAKWGKRFLADGIEGLFDRPGRGRKPFFPSGSCRSPRKDRLRTTGKS